MTGVALETQGPLGSDSQGDMTAAFKALDSYGALTREYRNEVHPHGHWGMLSLIVLDLYCSRLTLTERQAVLLASVLAASAAVFPLGVLLQSGPAAGFGKILSVAGSIGMVVGLLAYTYALYRAER